MNKSVTNYLYKEDKYSQRIENISENYGDDLFPEFVKHQKPIDPSSEINMDDMINNIYTSPNKNSVKKKKLA